MVNPIESSINYSLKSDFPQDIFSYKIIDLIKSNQMTGGGTNYLTNFDSISNCIIMILGIILIIIGFYLYWDKNEFQKVNAQIHKLSSDNINGMNKYNIVYIVEQIQYSKIIDMSQSFLFESPNIIVYYQKSDPNIMRLFNYNYTSLGLILIIVGIILFIYSLELIPMSFLKYTLSNGTNTNTKRIYYDE